MHYLSSRICADFFRKHFQISRTPNICSFVHYFQYLSTVRCHAVVTGQNRFGSYVYHTCQFSKTTEFLSSTLRFTGDFACRTYCLFHWLVVIRVSWIPPLRYLSRNLRLTKKLSNCFPWTSSSFQRSTDSAGYHIFSFFLFGLVYCLGMRVDNLLLRHKILSSVACNVLIFEGAAWLYSCIFYLLLTLLVNYPCTSFFRVLPTVWQKERNECGVVNIRTKPCKDCEWYSVDHAPLCY